MRLRGVGADQNLGGYGQGSSQQDLSYIINENGNNFVGVAIQYRVSANAVVRMRADETDALSSWVPSASCPRTRSSGMELSTLAFWIRHLR